MEKLTDRLSLNAFESEYGFPYNTQSNKSLFGKYIPDGWLLHDDVLFIIENKASPKDINKAEEQVRTYADIVKDEKPQLNIICITNFGNKSLITHIYEYTDSRELKRLNMTLSDLHKIYPMATCENEISTGNIQTLHNLIVKETGIDKTLDLSVLTAFLIILSKIPNMRKIITLEENIEINKSLCISEINRYYGKDDIVHEFFDKTLKDEVNLSGILKYILSCNDSHSLNELYKQFCKYTKMKQDKNIELTPDYIADIMRCLCIQYNPKSVIDPFSGSGSLLIGLPDNINKYAIDNHMYMYILTKINFLLNGNCIKYHVTYGRMEEQNISGIDVALTNPPWTKAISCRHPIEWLCELIGKVNAVVAIIPTSNLIDATFYKYRKQFTDNGYYLRKVINCGKCFRNIGHYASIIVVDRLHPKGLFKVCDCILKTKQDYIKPPLNDMQLTQTGIDKIEDIKNDKAAYVLVNDYDSNLTWANGSTDIDKLEIDTINKYTFEKYIDTLKQNGYVSFSVCKDAFDAFQEEIQQNEEDTKTLEKICIGEYFECVTKNKNYSYTTTSLPKDGKVPLFACKKLDNGVAGYVENEEYEGDVIVCINSMDSTCGYSYHYNGKLAWTNFCIVIRPTKNINMDICAKYMTIQVAPNHTKLEKFNKKSLMDKYIFIPKRALL